MTTGHVRHTLRSGRSRHRERTVEQTLAVPDNDIIDPHVSQLGSQKPGVYPILQGARHLLLRKLRNRDYESSLILLAALVETRRYSTLFYWKVKLNTREKNNNNRWLYSHSH